MLGVQTAKRVGKPTLIAATVVICIQKIYRKVRPNPMAIFTPTPPLFFSVETESPSSVKT